MRNTAKTSHKEEMWPKVRGTLRMTKWQLDPGYWRFSSSSSVDQQSSRSSRVSEWACKMKASSVHQSATSLTVR
ncbi:hypothetical protein AGOR_G00241630 [Albula goreensis]|uniref:Uncharacterized protein n=1 Tax=Albula goreensis TaxID=1534307 RepID=A0A8T3CGK4_9TELE|nr:hypothetical protein AGOR_G00241630 [Albula goreensis]